MSLNPENLVVAVLHKVGTETRLTDDVRLAFHFNNMAKQYPDVFGEFAWHPQYHDSRILRMTLQNLDLGGGILRENASIKRFRVSGRVGGNYGEAVFQALPDGFKGPVETLSEAIRNEFAVASE